MSLTAADCQKTHQFIKDNWQASITKDDGSNERSLGMPMPYVTPCVKGGHFTAMYYWDTFFTLAGAHLNGEKRLTGFCAENFMHLIESQGFIPNASVKGMQRSQPPVSSHVYKLAYECLGDKVMLRRGLNAAIAEHAMWMSQRSGLDQLNHFGHFGAPNDVKNAYWALRSRCPQLPENMLERQQFFGHKLGEAESGWDFTPRYRDRCMDIYAVDLNALLFACESHIAEFMQILDDRNAEKWLDIVAARRQRMNDFMWNKATGYYHDYDSAEKEQTPHLSAASYFAMWCGVPDQTQAEAMRDGLKQIEGEHGLDTMNPNTGERVKDVLYQWDSPNAWAPLQYAAIAGCMRYGFTEDAKRLAEKWVRTCNRNFDETGNLWEKYNAHTGGIDVVNEYEMPPFMGWTAGVYVYSLSILGLIDS